MTSAMLLGAGYGTRLRPLTEVQPKALVPVGGRPLLDWHLDALAGLGVDSVVLNASHLADQVASHVDRRGESPPRIEVLHEETPLETGGGLLGARRLFEREKCFLVINADIFHAIDLKGVLKTHNQAQADATLVVRLAGPEEPQDKLRINRDGMVTGIAGIERGTSGWRFTGIHVLTPAVFDYLTTSGSLVASYQGLFADGAKIVAHDCGEATWFDVGTPGDYLDANRAALEMVSGRRSSFPGVEFIEPTLVGMSGEIGIGCVIGPRTVIGEGVSIGPESQLSDSVVWPGVSIPPGSMLRHSIAYPGGTLTVPNRM